MLSGFQVGMEEKATIKHKYQELHKLNCLALHNFLFDSSPFTYAVNIFMADMNDRVYIVYMQNDVNLMSLKIGALSIFLKFWKSVCSLKYLSDLNSLICLHGMGLHQNVFKTKMRKR